MNDDFLYKLREEPPPAFARRLKARLDAQNGGSLSPRSRFLRGISIALLLGGTAYALGTGALKLFRTAEPNLTAASSATERAVSPTRVAPLRPSPRPPVDTTAERIDDTPAATLDAEAAASVGAAQAPSATPGPAAGSAGPQRGTPLAGGLTVVGTRGTEPHTEQVLTFLESRRSPRPTVGVEEASGVAARACDVARGTVDALVTFDPLPSSAWEPCAALLRATGRAPVELVVGYEAAVVARSVLYGRVELSARAVFLALARDIPDPRGSAALVPNPYRAWYEIDPTLPDYIAVMGPPRGSPAARALTELVMRPGCATLLALADLATAETGREPEVCRALRDDGPYTEYSAPNAALRRLENDPALFAVLGGEDFLRNRDKLVAAAFDGVTPSPETLANGTYPASRTLFVYTSRAGGALDRTELVQAYLRLPETARVLVAPDEATRREMWSRAGFLGGIGPLGGMR